VCDGHGGPETKDYLVKHLLPKIEEKILAKLDPVEHFDFDAKPKMIKDLDNDDIYNALTEAFIACNRDWLESVDRASDPKGALSGSTACVALVINEELWIANVGDTRAILIIDDELIQLTEDADPSVEKFADLVKENGGEITPYKTDDTEIHKVQQQKWDTAQSKWVPQPGVSVAQAFGDFSAKGITAVPQITYVTRIEMGDHPRLIIATDGLFSVASSEEVKDYVKTVGYPGDISKDLLKKARNAKNPDGKTANPDDITVMTLDILF
jgi:serine/threonine protein phosphatase PrpC